MAEIGFSVILSEERDQQYYEHVLRDMLTEGCTALELHARNRYPGWEPLIELIKEFGYIAVHANALVGQGDTAETAYFQALAQGVAAQTVTMHPARGQDIAKLMAAFPKTLAMENMDRNNKKNDYGQTVEDMEEILKAGMGWVFDSNHAAGIDPTLQLGRSMLATLPHDRLRHSHISGSEGHDADQLPHHTFHSLDQDNVLALTPQDRPIIIESLGLASPISPRTEDVSYFRMELHHVQRVLAEQRDLAA